MQHRPEVAEPPQLVEWPDTAAALLHRNHSLKALFRLAISASIKNCMKYAFLNLPLRLQLQPKLAVRLSPTIFCQINVPGMH